MADQLSKAEQRVLECLQKSPKQEYHINELIRMTKLLPRSISLAVNHLLQRGFIKEKRVANLRLISAKGTMQNIHTPRNSNTTTQSIKWQKVMTRQTWIGFQIELVKGCKQHITTLLHQPKNAHLYNYNWYNSLTGSVYAVNEEFIKLGTIVGTNLKGKQFAQEIIKDCRNNSTSLLKYTSSVQKQISKTLSDRSCIDCIKVFQTLYRRLMPHIVLGTAIEFGLLQILKIYLQNNKNVSNVDTTITKLTRPVTHTLDEYTDELMIASYIQNNTPFQEVQKKIAAHTAKYRFLSMQSPADHPTSRDTFTDSIMHVMKKVKNPKKKIQELKRQRAQTRSDLNTLLDKINASKAVRDIVWTLQTYISLRTERINVIYKAHEQIRPLFLEIARRCFLTPDDIFLLDIDELIKLLHTRSYIKQLYQLIRKRRNGWAVLMHNRNISILSGPNAILKAVERHGIQTPGYSDRDTQTGQISGLPAYRGCVTGTARVIQNIKELDQFQKGEILITAMTTPDFVTAMAKAKAFVTDEGGITCHAAIVAREMQIPCIVGTRTATKTIKTGYCIQVDATTGNVQIIEGEPIPMSHKKKLTGIAAYHGKVRGKISVIKSPSNPLPKPGIIAVLSAATADYLPFLYRAKALIIEEEALTSHGYFYANALKIPTLMGVKDATRMLINDQHITLNTHTQTVTV